MIQLDSQEASFSDPVVLSQPASPPDCVHFCVQAAADSATLSRVLEYFALNNILPETVRSRRFVDGNLVIDLKVKDLDEKRVSVIANKLRSSVLVFGVTVEWISAGQGRQDSGAMRAVA
ncbi:hypothetical protein [Govanella unica]|uniref:ACT domain-containing protein n=1 Tax=Govanella unica TaxID=2975056 RepID=A0A9X3Z6J1_9PROT|nr:hypothetical protein [Govania unica]MDA5193142.1 hypothetical protein [Govania unica]